MLKLISVQGSDTTELDKYLSKGWKIKTISSSSAACVVNGVASFYSFCHVVIED